MGFGNYIIFLENNFASDHLQKLENKNRTYKSTSEEKAGGGE